jgi:signal transduction histidine kinase/CheY-like chemotaxis protein
VRPTDTSPAPEAASPDIVGDRHQLLSIGMAAVFVACVVFGALRLFVQLASGKATPWWGNAGGAVAIAVVYLWYRRARQRRSSVGVHATALTATVALLVPAAYGMGSSKWWLALVGFSVVLMGRRREAIFWGAATLVLVPLAAALEPFIRVDNAVGEPTAERAMAGLFFVALLLAITWAFRRVAEQRARTLAELSDSLARASRVKSRFLAHMSHDVRTPLHGTIAMTDLALRGELSPEAREQIETANRSAHVLLGLLNNILDVARAESDAIVLEQKPFPLHRSLVELLHPLAAQAKARGLDFSARSAPQLVEERVGDRLRVTQIVLNLVANAIKFTPAGEVAVRLSADADAVLIEVRDTGVGIAADKLEQIFQPFAQSSAADARLQGGAGLGLSIVRELAKRMGGGVSVESTPGVGSRFSVRLPLPPSRTDGAPGPIDLLPAPAEATSPPPVAPARKGLDVLVCEDNHMLQRVFRLTLARLGHRVTVVDDGLRADEILRARRFDLVLTDVDMPGLSGVEVTRRMREREIGVGRTPVVATTGHAGREEEARVLAAGADAFLAKPFDLAALSSALERALNEGRRA